ncbi:MAG: flagellar hook-length control protein FliK [Deltaproteobacteria bacterium]|nr:MAG: flagellar hook-length control protein FliK [Deltaproteobacteria bacterium]
MSRINNNPSQQTQAAQQANQRPTPTQTQKSGESAFASRFQKKPTDSNNKQSSTTNNNASSNSSLLKSSSQAEKNPSSMMMQRHGAPVLGRRGGNTVADLQAKLQVEGEGGGSNKLGATAGAEGASAEGLGLSVDGEGKGVGKNIDTDNLLTTDGDAGGAVTNDLAGAAAGQNPLQQGLSAMKGAMTVEVQGNKIPTAMLDKIVDQARVGVNEAGAPEFQFDLKGDVLGGMKMRMSMEEGQLKAIFIAENPEVRKLIDGNLKDLQRHLEDRGIHIRDLEVRDPEEDRRQRQREQNQKDREQAMG